MNSLQLLSIVPLEPFNFTQQDIGHLKLPKVTTAYDSLNEEFLTEITHIAQDAIDRQTLLHNRRTRHYLEGRLADYFEISPLKSGELSSEKFDKKIDHIIKCLLECGSENPENLTFVQDLVNHVASLKLTSGKLGIEALTQYILDCPSLGTDLLKKLEFEEFIDLFKKPNLTGYQVYRGVKDFFNELKKREPSLGNEMSSELKMWEDRVLDFQSKNIQTIEKKVLAKNSSDIESSSIKEISIKNRVLCVPREGKLSRLDSLEENLLKYFQENLNNDNLNDKNFYEISEDLVRFFFEYARNIPKDSLLANLFIKEIYSTNWAFLLNTPQEDIEQTEQQIKDSLIQNLETLQKQTLNRVSSLKNSVRQELISQAYKTPSIPFHDFDAIYVEGDSQPILKADLKDLTDVLCLGEDEEGNKVSFKIAPAFFTQSVYIQSLKSFEFSKQWERIIELEILYVGFKTMVAINEFAQNPSNLKITQDNVVELFFAAEFLQIDELRKALFHFLVKNIHMKEVKEIILEALDEQTALGELFSNYKKEFLKKEFLLPTLNQVKSLKISKETNINVFLRNLDTLIWTFSHIPLDDPKLKDKLDKVLSKWIREGKATDHLKQIAFYFLEQNPCAKETSELILEILDVDTRLGKLFYNYKEVLASGILIAIDAIWEKYVGSKTVLLSTLDTLLSVAPHLPQDNSILKNKLDTLLSSWINFYYIEEGLGEAERFLEKLKDQNIDLFYYKNLHNDSITYTELLFKIVEQFPNLKNF